MKLGTKVIFHPKVFKKPYTPYYDAYKGHVFEVTGYMVDEGEVIEDHVSLWSLTDTNLIVSGYVHTNELLTSN